ncbi:MAG TPA: DUF3467 domain-containing protein [Candidatus Saccharimonadales bacterium]|nr:DUF3467 domain-containing protein [Candidatus Saccharimonadales bacterium]
MDDQQKQQNVNFNVNPDKTPVYFIDGFVIGSNPQAVTLNFAQAVVSGEQQQIVARVAMTVPQAKEFLKSLNDHIEKFER